MRGYFGLGQLSAAEKSDILNQHKSVYNGYQTMQPQVSNTQPLTVYDFAGDKEGLVVNNKGEVKKYTNMGINEQVEIDVLGGKTKGKENDFKKLRKDRNEEKDMVVIDVLGGKTKDEEKNFKNLRKDRTEQIVIDDVIIGKTNPKEVCDDCGAMIMDGMCTECNYGHMEESYLEEGNMCEQCGGTMKEDVCEQCGSGKMEEETGHLDDIYKVRDLNLKKGDYDYVEGGGNDYGTFEGMHKNLYKEQDDDDFMDYESSYTEDGMDDPDNEDDGYEDMNASEVTDGEMDEIDIKDLVKGKKYRYKSPSHQDDVEFGDEHEYHDGGNMYGFKGGDTGYSLGKRSVEDFINNLDDEDEELYEQGFTGGGNAPDMDLSNIDPGYDFESDGPDQFQKSSDNLDVEDEDEDSETPAFDFESGGANSGYPIFEDDMYGYDPEKDYETMESAWADDEVELDEQPDISGVQGIYGAMDKAYDFDSGGPGKAGPYQEFSYESELDEEDDFEEVDEDLKESFLIQKNKINEMFNRFSKYN
jgi:hypothetical protein